MENKGGRERENGKRRKEVGEGGRRERRKGGGKMTDIKPSLAQLTIRVPSCTKSTPPTGSEWAGSERMRRAERTSHRKTASS
jgi:hypothetical protein